MRPGERVQGVHLVGSVPLRSSEEVFRTCVSILGGRLRRLPDGETGERSSWISWQRRVLAETVGLEPAQPAPEGYGVGTRWRFRVRESVKPEEIRFGSLGYADAALSSYRAFGRLRDEGTIPSGVRFQVSLPTPVAVLNAFIRPEDAVELEAAYERQILQELERIQREIPHHSLAVQWDVAAEFGILEGVFTHGLRLDEPAVVERVARLGNAVADDVELGYHLCYGDAGHRHFKEPEDTSLLVRVANDIGARLPRSIHWIHLPVPRARTDDAYFRPLRDLCLHPETELYLGLVHMTDGVEGTQHRIEAALRTVDRFGVATECGMGRRDPNTIPALLRVHAAIAAPVL